MNTNDAINAKKLCKIVKKKTKLPLEDVEQAVKALLKEIGKGVVSDEKVVIFGFGKWHRWYFKGRMCRIYGHIPAHWRLYFKASGCLKEIVNHERPIPATPKPAPQKFVPRLRQANYTAPRVNKLPRLSVRPHL
jgi:nucleoid DNA-binding protein